MMLLKVVTPTFCPVELVNEKEVGVVSLALVVTAQVLFLFPTETVVLYAFEKSASVPDVVVNLTDKVWLFAIDFGRVVYDPALTENSAPPVTVARAL